MPIFAALDLGTNSTLLLATHAEAGRLVEDDEYFESTRLGEGLGETGRLSEAAMTRTLDAAESMLKKLPGGVEGQGIAAGTSALRDAENAEEFLTRFAERFGAKPLILSGVEEAESIFAAAASDCAPDEFAVTVDVGGGSTEIGAGAPDNTSMAVSLSAGCVRFGEQFNLYEVAREKDIDAARQAALTLIGPVAETIQRSAAEAKKVRVIASGGTATTLAAAQKQLATYDRAAVHGTVVSRKDLVALMQRLFRMPSAKRAGIAGITPGRAPVLPTGLLILATVLKGLEADEVYITTRGLRYGLALRLRNGELAATWTW